VFRLILALDLQSSIQTLFRFGLSSKVLPSMPSLDPMYLEFGLTSDEFEAVNEALEDHDFNITVPTPAPTPAPTPDEDEFGEMTFANLRTWPRDKLDR
jgi:hypothetical protein